MRTFSNLNLQRFLFPPFSVKFFISILFCSFVLSCQFGKKKSTTLVSLQSHRILFEIGNKNIEKCIYRVEDEPDGCITIPHPIVPCKKFTIEENFTNLSPSDSSDLILRGISEVELNHPKLTKNLLTTMVFLKEGHELSRDKDRKVFTDALRKDFVNRKIPLVLIDEDRNKFLSDFQKDYFPNKELFDNLLISSENLFFYFPYPMKSQKPYYDLPIGVRTVFEKGGFVKDTFHTCRQPISVFFSNYYSGWENFEFCREYILSEFEKSGFQKQIQPIDSRKTGQNLVVYGEIWEELSLLFLKNEITRNEIHNSVRFYCKANIPDLLKQGNSERLSYHACYYLSYADAIMKSFRVDSIHILKGNLFSSYLAGSKIYAPECKPSGKKK
ncbi:MAG: hypothetical protein H7A24_04870 [Leptospiraceae bacterium]|nr:hypothetical protein [Leptospiraceae bacterium]